MKEIHTHVEMKSCEIDKIKLSVKCVNLQKKLIKCQKRELLGLCTPAEMQLN